MQKKISILLIIIGLVLLLSQTNDKGGDLLGFYSSAGIQPSVLTIEMNRKAEFSQSLTPSLDKLNYR